MADFSVLIGGKAGEGINQAASLIAHLLNRLGWRIYVYLDYPSLIRGGHNFAIIRASDKKIAVHRDKIDVLLALNQDTVDFHKHRLKEGSIIIYDSDAAKSEGRGLPLEKMVKEEGGSAIMRNSCIIGAFCKAAGIKQDVLEEVFKKHIPRETDLNIKIALRGYNGTEESLTLPATSQAPFSLFTGNEAIGLGLIKAGLKSYIAYPMTPSSGILHFLAGLSKDLSLKVVHPESEISVILMALGFAYCGEKAAVGTSGGGFCLMNEGLSLAGMAELPVVIVMGQRPGPSTGVPTYTAQADLNFVLNAGHGEFVRLVTAPGDAEEACYWSAVALNIAWKYQIPCFVLTDKTLNEATFSFEASAVDSVKEEPPLLWDKDGDYKRYLDTETGVSPMAFVPRKGAVIKASSYEHDGYGITTEDPATITSSYDKRLRKEKYLAQDLENYEAVKAYGNPSAECAVVCWGSNKGVCVEAAEKLGLKVIQPLVLSPFPLKQFSEKLKGAKKIICVENNATGMLAGLMSARGLKADKMILKYDGRPFSLDELEERLKKDLE